MYEDQALYLGGAVIIAIFVAQFIILNDILVKPVGWVNKPGVKVLFIISTILLSLLLGVGAFVGLFVLYLTLWPPTY